MSCRCSRLNDPFCCVHRSGLPMLYTGPDNTQNCSFQGRSRPIQYMVFGFTCISPQNGISIGSAVFAHLTRVLNTQSHRQTSKQTHSDTVHNTCDSYRPHACMYLRPILHVRLQNVVVTKINALSRLLTNSCGMVSS